MSVCKLLRIDFYFSINFSTFILRSRAPLNESYKIVFYIFVYYKHFHILLIDKHYIKHQTTNKAKNKMFNLSCKKINFMQLFVQRRDRIIVFRLYKCKIVSIVQYCWVLLLSSNYRNICFKYSFEIISYLLIRCTSV